MSDTSFPDSWQAGDGKWYPLAAHPDHGVSVAPPVVPEPESSTYEPSMYPPLAAERPSAVSAAGVVASGADDRSSAPLPTGGSGRRRLFVAAVAGLLVGGLAIGLLSVALLRDGTDDSQTEFQFGTAEAGTDNGDQRNPLAAGSDFEVTARYEDRVTVASGSVHGIVELAERSEFDRGTCIAVVGEVTLESAPGRLGDSGLIVSLGDNDRLQRGENYACDASSLEEAGYAPLEGTAVAVGESFSFHQLFRMRTDDLPDHVVLGTFRDQGLYTYQPEVLDELPRSVRAADDPDIELRASGATVEWVEANGDIYEFTVEGYVETEVSEYSDTTGRCFAVVASFTPVDLQGKQYGSPRASTFVLDDGVAQQGGFGGDCDVDDALERGYDYEYSLVPEEFATGDYLVLSVSMTDGPDAVVIGTMHDDNLIGFELDELDQIPQI